MFSYNVIIGVRSNIYTYGDNSDSDEFILLAVQHYYIMYGKDVEAEKMKQIILEIMPAPRTNLLNNDGKGNKKIKSFMTEKEIAPSVQAAIEKDTDVSSIPIRNRIDHFDFHSSLNVLSNV